MLRSDGTALLLVAAAAALAACATAGPGAGPEILPVDFAAPVDLEEDDFVVGAAVLESKAPVYPPRLRLRGVEGEVVARGIIGEDGRLRSLRVLRAADPLLGEALLAALVEWRFRPATVNGEPVPVFYQIVHTFRLD